MKSGSLNKLMILTVAVVVGALWAWQGLGSADLPERGRLFVPTFAEQINDATSIALITADGSFSLRRDDGDWVITEWGGYPADYAQVKQTLMGLADLEIIESKTAKASNHGQMGLEQPGSPGGTSLGLTITGSGDASLANIVLGNPRSGHQQQHYARRAGEDQTWLVSGDLEPPRELSGWVDKELLRLAAASLNRVVITHPDGEVVEIRKSADGDWTLADVPQDRTVKEYAGLSSLAGALAYLDMESVVPAAEQAERDLEWTLTRFERPDGLVLDVSTAEDGDERWARFEVSQIDAAEPTADEEAAAAAGAAVGQAVAEEVDELRGRLSGWTYRLSSWKADSLRKHLEDYLEELPDEIEEPPEEIEEPPEEIEVVPEAIEVVPEAIEEPVEAVDGEPEAVEASEQRTEPDESAEDGAGEQGL
jgi:hypothetical protein